MVQQAQVFQLVLGLGMLLVLGYPNLFPELLKLVTTQLVGTPMELPQGLPFGDSNFRD